MDREASTIVHNNNPLSGFITQVTTSVFPRKLKRRVVFRSQAIADAYVNQIVQHREIAPRKNFNFFLKALGYDLLFFF